MRACLRVRRVTHHGELRLQLLHPVLLHVHLGSKDVGLLRGLFGLPPQVPLLPLQHVLLLGQRFHCVLALLMVHRRTREAARLIPSTGKGLESGTRGLVHLQDLRTFWPHCLIA